MDRFIKVWCRHLRRTKRRTQKCQRQQAFIVVCRLFAFVFLPSVFSLITGASIATGDDFFPIGLFEAGRWRVSPNEIESLNDCNHCNAYTPADSALLTGFRWTTLDEARGAYPLPGIPIRDYTSSINVVFDYSHMGMYWTNEASKDNWEAQRYLSLARALGFRVLLALPAYEHEYPDSTGKYSAALRHYFSRSPRVWAPDSIVIAKFKADTTVYGWYVSG